MFKRLKEKKESENQNSNKIFDKHFDENYINNEENDNSIENDLNTNYTDFERDLSEKCDSNISNNGLKTIESLNEELIKLKNDLILSQNLNTSLVKELKDYKMNNQLLNNELMTKSEEIRQLKAQISEYPVISGEKDDLMMRNAELSNQLENLRQQLEEEMSERRDLLSKLESNKQSDNNLVNDKLVLKLNEKIIKLEESLNDRNKTIKLQHQRLHDIKKTFHRDIQNQSNRDESSADESPKHTNTSINNYSNQMNEGSNGREINFTYLKNVVFKYMISSEYEAIHLVKAISMLLSFTKEEEKLIKKTIEWKMSWFAPLVASKPSLPNRK